VLVAEELPLAVDVLAVLDVVVPSVVVLSLELVDELLFDASAAYLSRNC
jgi:hypothetical protein